MHPTAAGAGPGVGARSHVRSARQGRGRTGRAAFQAPAHAPGRPRAPLPRAEPAPQGRHGGRSGPPSRVSHPPLGPRPRRGPGEDEEEVAGDDPSIRGCQRQAAPERGTEPPRGRVSHREASAGPAPFGGPGAPRPASPEARRGPPQPRPSPRPSRPGLAHLHRPGPAGPPRPGGSAAPIRLGPDAPEAASRPARGAPGD